MAWSSMELSDTLSAMGRASSIPAEGERVSADSYVESVQCEIRRPEPALSSHQAKKRDSSFGTEGAKDQRNGVSLANSFELACWKNETELMIKSTLNEHAQEIKEVLKSTLTELFSSLRLGQLAAVVRHMSTDQSSSSRSMMRSSFDNSGSENSLGPNQVGDLNPPNSRSRRQARRLRARRVLVGAVEPDAGSSSSSGPSRAGSSRDFVRRIQDAIADELMAPLTAVAEVEEKSERENEEENAPVPAAAAVPVTVAPVVIGAVPEAVPAPAPSLPQLPGVLQNLGSEDEQTPAARPSVVAQTSNDSELHVSRPLNGPNGNASPARAFGSPTRRFGMASHGLPPSSQPQELQGGGSGSLSMRNPSRVGTPSRGFGAPPPGAFGPPAAALGAATPSRGASRPQLQGSTPLEPVLAPAAPISAVPRHATMTKMRKYIQGRLATDLSQRLPPTAGEDEFVHLAPTKINALLEKVTHISEAATRIALKLGGVVPWNCDFYRISLAYQIWVIVLNALIFSFTVTGYVNLSLQEAAPRLYSDVAISSGCVFGLIGTLALKGSGLCSILEKLQRYAEKHSFQQHVALSNCGDSLLTCGMWVAFLAARLACRAALLGGLEHFNWVEGVDFASMTVASFVMMCLAILVMRVTRVLGGMVDSFCFRMWSELEYPEAVVQWNTLQASMRKACGSVEQTFCALQGAMLLATLLLVLDFRQVSDKLWALCPMMILVLAASQIFLRAASVTEACHRVAPVINSLSITEEPLDTERMYLVDYIVASMAGFHVYDVRLNIGLVIRLFHFVGLAAFTVSTRLLAV